MCGIELGIEVKRKLYHLENSLLLPNTSSCQSSLAHLEDRMWILTLKKSDRKPGTQNKKTVSQKSKAGGMQLVPEQQGPTGSGVQTGGRR